MGSNPTGGWPYANVAGHWQTPQGCCCRCCWPYHPCRTLSARVFFKSATASGPPAQAEPGVAPLNAVSLRGGTPPVELLLVPPPSSHESPLLLSLSLTAAAAVSVVADIAAAVGIGLALLPPPWHTSGGVMRAWPFFLLLRRRLIVWCHDCDGHLPATAPLHKECRASGHLCRRGCIP